jgi:hypothetical protein
MPLGVVALSVNSGRLPVSRNYQFRTVSDSGWHGEDGKRQYHYTLETPLLVDLADLLYSGIVFTFCLKSIYFNER